MNLKMHPEGVPETNSVSSVSLRQFIRSVVIEPCDPFRVIVLGDPFPGVSLRSTPRLLSSTPFGVNGDFLFRFWRPQIFNQPLAYSEKIREACLPNFLHLPFLPTPHSAVGGLQTTDYRLQTTSRTRPYRTHHPADVLHPRCPSRAHPRTCRCQCRANHPADADPPAHPQTAGLC